VPRLRPCKGEATNLSARATGVVALTLILLCGRATFAQVNVTTSYYNNQRTGVNSQETILTPQNVNPNSFGKLFSQVVDGSVYAQPLYVANVVIPNKGTHNVVYVATEHDTVYAFDADDNTGPNAQPLWRTSFLSSTISSVPSTNLGTTDIIPEIGITSTPVIDLSSNTIYVVAETLENGSNYVKRLHALDITTGAEKAGSPAAITASVAGTGQGSKAGMVSLNVQWQMNRAGLLLYNGVLYIGFGSHQDFDIWHGWVLGYDASSLQQVFTFCDTPNAYQAGIWMAGEGLPMDSGSNVFFSTGNGGFDASNSSLEDYGDSIIRLDLSKGAMVQDYFTPSNQSALDTSDMDLGSGGVLILPDQPGPNTHLLVQAGKKGTIYLIDRDNMGQFNSSSNNIVQELVSAVGSMYSTPVYFNGKVFFWGQSDVVKAFALTNGLLSTSPQDQGSTTLGFPGAHPVISANGSANAILWALESDNYSMSGPSGPAVLRAYDATNLSGGEIYNSNKNQASDNPGGAVKFAVPTVANGKVYVGAEGVLSVFGELASVSRVAKPSIAPTAQTFTGSLTVSISDTTSGATIFYTTDGSTPQPGAGSTLQYAAPFNITATTTINAMGVANGFSNSAMASVTYTLAPPPPPVVQISPSSVTLSDSRTQQFTASVTGTSNTSVTWSLSPALGTLSSSGLYTAPSNINSAQSVSVVATSVADTRQSASAVINLLPPPIVKLSPASASLLASQTQQFTATVTGASNTAVTWAFSPAVGMLSSTGLYTAPATINAGQSVQVTATSVADASQSASAVINLLPPPASPDFKIAAQPTATSLRAGQSATISISIVGTAGFNSNVTLACADVPANSTCAFSPQSVTAGSSPANSTLIIQTAGAAARLLPAQPAILGNSGMFLAFGGIGMGMALLGLGRQKRYGLLVILLAAMAGLGSCGGSVNVDNKAAATPVPATPAGVANVAVIASSSMGGATITHQVPVSITVTQ
jgi:chitobiase/beta-hexosaminidase-like protein